MFFLHLATACAVYSSSIFFWFFLALFLHPAVALTSTGSCGEWTWFAGVQKALSYAVAQSFRVAVEGHFSVWGC